MAKDVQGPVEQLKQEAFGRFTSKGEGAVLFETQHGLVDENDRDPAAVDDSEHIAGTKDMVLPHRFPSGLAGRAYLRPALDGRQGTNRLSAALIRLRRDGGGQRN
ncbi:MAG: hypothetical protein RBS57_10900 [Desulforhabdus sp.]|nr:hypothetical protein [Desulforhabdus sp.]